MKHTALRSIAHNLADSLASGLCLLIGVYDLDVFADATRSPEGVIGVDFLSGRVVEGTPSPRLAVAVTRYGEVFDDFCLRSGTHREAFRQCVARFWVEPLGTRFSVLVEDARGRATTTEYGGTPGYRLELRDGLGRRRPKPSIEERPINL